MSDMSIGVPIHINLPAQPKEIGQTAPAERARVGGDKKATTDGALLQVVSQHVQAQAAMALNQGHVELATPTESKFGLSSVDGIAQRSNQIALSQSEGMSGVHQSLARDHVSQSAGDADKSAGYSFGNDAMFNLELQFNDSLFQDRETNINMMGSALKLERSMAMDAAQRYRDIGKSQEMSAITGSVLNASMTLGGAFLQNKGLDVKEDAIRNELKPQAELKRLQSGQENALRGMSAPSMPDKNSLELASGEKIGLEPHSERLSEDHRKVLSEDAPKIQQQIDNHGIRHEQQQVVAEKLRVKGEVVRMMGGESKNMAEGVGADKQGELRAEQKNEETSQQTYSALVAQSKEAAQRDESAATQALQAARDAVSTESGLAGTVAGNMRA